MPEKKVVTKEYGTIKGPYVQSTVRARIEALFLDNVGKVITRQQIQEVAKDPHSGRTAENWHQRLSELRTDFGYTILSWRDTPDLKVSEYLLPNTTRRASAAARVKPSNATWEKVVQRSGNSCEWNEGGIRCNLKNGEQDPVGGGTVRLTPDHKNPHSIEPNADPNDPTKWQALCGRHQVMKKNYWDDSSGWLNVLAIVQAASRKTKQEVYRFLKRYFGDA